MVSSLVDVENDRVVGSPFCAEHAGVSGDKSSRRHFDDRPGTDCQRNRAIRVATNREVAAKVSWKTAEVPRSTLRKCSARELDAISAFVALSRHVIERCMRIQLLQDRISYDHRER